MESLSLNEFLMKFIRFIRYQIAKHRRIMGDIKAYCVLLAKYTAGQRIEMPIYVGKYL